MKNKLLTLHYMKTPSRGLMRTAAALTTLSVFLFTFAGTASAAILFQDDTFADVESDAIKIGSNDAGAVNTAIRFGADAVATENGNITWNIATNRFGIDHSVDVTGGLTADGDVNFSSSTQTRIRESANPTTSAACTAVNEIIANTTLNRLEICTVIGGAGAATWIALPAGDASTLGGFTASQFLRSDTADSYTSGTLTMDAGTTLDVNGAADFAGATAFTMTQGAADPALCSVGQLFYNTTSNVLRVCAGVNTWSTAGPQDFESVYAKDADATLTTSGGSFTISSGIGNVNITSTSGKTTVTSTAAAADSIKLNASGALSGITGAWGAGGLNFSSASGAFSITGTGASTLGAASGNLNLQTTTSGNVAVSSAAYITFDDAQLTSAIKLTDTATAIAAAYGTTGIVDAMNTLTATTAGDGASNVGLEAGSLTNVVPASNDVQAALEALDASVGAGAVNNGVLNFSPEYPDTVVYKDGTSNNGTLIADYDNTNNEHYYEWTTNGATLQDIDLRFRFPLPADFTATGDFTGLFQTGTATATDNKVDFTVSNATDLTLGAPTTCGTSTGNVNASWTTATITAGTINTGCTGGTALSATDIVQIIVKLYDTDDGVNPGTFARAGRVALGYSN